MPVRATKQKAKLINKAIAAGRTRDKRQAASVGRFIKSYYEHVPPQDIVEYELPTHPLKDVDVKRAKDALKNDPFFQRHKPWRKALEQLIKMGVRAEQQALAMWGLNYVIDEYLPAKLQDPSKFLP